MLMPAGAFQWWAVRLHQLRDHPPAGGTGNAKVAIEEEVTQPVGDPWRVHHQTMSNADGADTADEATGCGSPG